eukprot:968114-Prymnesium_polylepis.1
MEACDDDRKSVLARVAALPCGVSRASTFGVELPRYVVQAVAGRQHALLEDTRYAFSQLVAGGAVQ